MIKAGLPKGVVKNKTLNLVENIIGNSIDKNRLIFYNDSMQFFLLKHRDIPKLVHKGLLDFGITSSEWINECGYEFKIVKELDWCNTRVSLISEAGNPVLSRLGIKCVTEFPRIAARFFKDIGYENVEIEHISGSSEGVVPILYDCCIDCVETGTTLKLHNLVEEKVIIKSRVVVITREDSDAELEGIIKQILGDGDVN